MVCGCACVVADPDLDLLVLGWSLQTSNQPRPRRVPCYLSLGAIRRHQLGAQGQDNLQELPLLLPALYLKRWSKISVSGLSVCIITGTHSFLAVTHLSLSHRQINNRGSKPGTKHWHAKKHIDKPSFSSLHEFGDSGNMSSGEESSLASKFVFLKKQFIL